MNQPKTYVVDQGWMRSPDLANLIAAEPQSHFVIPDVSGVEMSKSGNWEGTMRSSLANFYPAVERIFMSLSVGEALATELQTRQSIRSQLVPADFTLFLRSLIEELAENRVGPSVTKMQANFAAAFSDLKANELSVADAKPRLTGLVQPWVKGLKKSVLNLLRRDPVDDRFRLGLIQANASMFAKKIATNSGMSEETAQIFLDSQPLLVRYVYVFTRHSLWWAARNGWTNVDPAKALNHFLDQEYVVIASFFDELLTKDGDARDAYDDLKTMLSTPLSGAVEYCNSVLCPQG